MTSRSPPIFLPRRANNGASWWRTCSRARQRLAYSLRLMTRSRSSLSTAERRAHSRLPGGRQLRLGRSCSALIIRIPRRPTPRPCTSSRMARRAFPSYSQAPSGLTAMAFLLAKRPSRGRSRAFTSTPALSSTSNPVPTYETPGTCLRGYSSAAECRPQVLMSASVSTRSVSRRSEAQIRCRAATTSALSAASFPICQRKAFAARLPPPMGGSFTTPADRRHRSSPTSWRWRLNICACSKRAGSRSMPLAA